MIFFKILVHFFILYFFYFYKQKFPSSFFINILIILYFFISFYIYFISKQNKFIKTFVKRSIFIFSSIFIFTLGTIICDIHNSKNRETKNEYVIILGAGLRGVEPKKILRYRLDKAIKYYKKYPDTIFIVSGGKGKDEIISESKAMKNYLLKASIPTKNIIEENKSSTTLENLLFSKKIIPKKIASVGIISNDFHMYRVKFFAKNIDFKLNAIYADTPNKSKVSMFLRETLAVIYYKVKMNIFRYFYNPFKNFYIYLNKKSLE